jgi:hypothetical protein
VAISCQIALGRFPATTGNASARNNPWNPTAHAQAPCNRNDTARIPFFADGHSESPIRNAVIDPHSAYWRARWNNDNDPHLNDTSPITWTTSNTGALEQQPNPWQFCWFDSFI